MTEERPLAGVVDLLKSLQAAGHPLALWALENCDQEAIGDKVARLGLSPFFDFIARAELTAWHLQGVVQLQHLLPARKRLAG